jgi:alpha-tubulin suppressor-like RCC1 family protein
MGAGLVLVISEKRTVSTGRKQKKILRAAYMNLSPSFSSQTSRTMLMDEHGDLWVCGDNTSGCLGLGTTQDEINFQVLRLPSKFSIASLAMGFRHTMALLEDGSLYTWGENTSSQLGLPGGEERHVPCLLELPEPISSITCGEYFSLALTPSGTLLAWGDNNFGQLALPLSTVSVPTPVPLDFTLVALSCGDGQTIGLTDTGHVYSWGYNHVCQLGTDADTGAPPQKIPELKDITAIACGGFHTFALAKDGSLYAWGSNDCGQLGLGPDRQNQPTPVLLPHLDAPVRQVTCGWKHTMILTQAGSLYLCGDNQEGRLGFPDLIQRFVPEKLEIPTNSPIASIICGFAQSMVVTISGDLLVWGRNGSGRLGLGDCLDRRAPKIVENFRWKIPEEISSPTSFYDLPSPENFADLALFVGEDSKLLWHKPIIETRCPVLLPFLVPAESTLAPENTPQKFKLFGVPVIHQLQSFLYKNSVEFNKLNPVEVIKLLEISKILEVQDLTLKCQKRLLNLLTIRNYTEILITCANSENLRTETGWVIEFLRKFHQFPPPTVLEKIPLEIRESLIEGEGSDDFPPILKVPPPEPISKLSKKFFRTGIYSDFELKVSRADRSETKIFKLHKFITCKWIYWKTFISKSGTINSGEHVTEMPISSFAKIIEYFYGCLKNLTFVDCWWILSFSGYYLLEEQGLPCLCNTKLNSEFGEGDSLEAWKAGIQLGDSGILEKAAEKMKSFPGSAVNLAQEAWMENQELKEKVSKLERRVGELERGKEEVEKSMEGRVESLEEQVRNLQEQLNNILVQIRN